MRDTCEDCGTLMERAGCPNCNELDVINDLFSEEIDLLTSNDTV